LQLDAIVLAQPAPAHLPRRVRAEDPRPAAIYAGSAERARRHQLERLVAELDPLGAGIEQELIAQVRAAVHDRCPAGPHVAAELDRQTDEPVGAEIVAARVLDAEARERGRLH